LSSPAPFPRGAARPAVISLPPSPPHGRRPAQVGITQHRGRESWPRPTAPGRSCRIQLRSTGRQRASTPTLTRHRRQPALPAALLARPEPNRASLRQAEGAAPQGRSPHPRGALDHHRPLARHLHPSRVPKLPRQLRLCVRVNRKCSRCLISGCGGTLDRHAARDAPWARFFTAAPARRRRFVARSSYNKRA
jgi:hypothetical protein